MRDHKSLFLQQSYLDSYSDYTQSIQNEEYPVWDYVILTASNETQAEAYRQQLEQRLSRRQIPARTHYAVLPDPEGKRVGSGGATLNGLRYIRQREPSFDGLKILMIHSGGDSKRVPQYSVCGKLFSPVPRVLPDGRRSSLFDEFIIGLTAVPQRIPAGMLVCSGDVLLLFNPLQIDFYGRGAAALSIKESTALGKNHGVFLGDGEGNVRRFLHKQTEETLRSCGAADAHGNVDIDTGAVVMSSHILNDLYRLVETPEGFAAFVNDRARLSFYADFLYPLASAVTLEEYQRETPEGELTPELAACRRELWRVLHPYTMKLLRFSPAAFVHFGTTWELRRLMTEEIGAYSFLGWSGNVITNHKQTDFAASNAYISPRAAVGAGCYIEDSCIHRNSVVGAGCVLSGVTLNGEQVPAHTVLHGVKLKDGRFVVRMYGVEDNPKQALYRGEPIDEPLWTAPRYPVCATVEEALRRTLAGESTPEMLSLQESFQRADAAATLAFQEKMSDRVRVELLLERIEQRQPAATAAAVFPGGISRRAVELLLERVERLDEMTLQGFSRKIRIYYYLSRLLTGKQQRETLDACFATVCRVITQAPGELYRPQLRIREDEVVTRLPVRVNFGGGWSDTPPYCLENGGTVLNAAIRLNGEYPIEAVVRRLPERKVVLASADNDSYGEFTALAPLQDCRDPGDPFALHKAALLACGVLPRQGDAPLEMVLERLGGGVYLSTRVIHIPRGSGLGTSSILAAACVKGLDRFFGLHTTENEMFRLVLCMEQLMSTGGGWQDQVGGLLPGIKLVSAPAGLSQQIQSVPLHLTPQTVRELNDRFAIIYTGQRRLARNLLREVVGQYIGADPDTVQVLYEIQQVAALMRFELERGNVDGFAALLDRHWALSRKMDMGCTNTCIDQIFLSVEDLIDGRMICGAGGGGFLQVVMKKQVTAEQLQERLRAVFADSGVEVWRCELAMD